MSGKGIRKTLYLRATKDTDLIDYVTPLLERDDFSTVVRDLMRDGVCYRNSPSLYSRDSVLQSVTSSEDITLDDVLSDEIDLSDTDLEERLDNF